MIPPNNMVVNLNGKVLQRSSVESVKNPTNGVGINSLSVQNGHVSQENGETVEKLPTFRQKSDGSVDVSSLIAMSQLGNSTQEIDESEEDYPNPLDTKVTHDLDLGWITRYTELMYKLTGSPKEFHQLAALATIATAIQGKGRLQMSFGEVNANLYCCIIAPSSAFGKSTALHKPRMVLKAAMMDKLLIPAQGSGEGLVQQLSETPNALMIRDEIGTLFSSDKIKYLQDYKQLLTAIYDGYPIERKLRTEEISVEKPYLNIIGATTPAKFYSSITQADWDDGLLPRWLFAVAEGRPNFDDDPTPLTEEHINQTNKLALKLLEIEQYAGKNFTLTGNSLATHTKWRKAGREAAWDAQDFVALSIVSRYATYALKFAIILAAANDSWGVITPEIMDTSIKLAENYMHRAYRIIEDKDKYRITGDKMQKVFAAIRGRNTGDGVSSREVRQFTHLTKSEVDDCIAQLVEVGAVTSHKASAKLTKYVATVAELQLKRWQ